MKTIFLPLLIALALAGCTTAQKARLRSDGKAFLGFAKKTAAEIARAELEAAIQDAIR